MYRNLQLPSAPETRKRNTALFLDRMLKALKEDSAERAREDNAVDADNGGGYGDMVAFSGVREQ